MSDRKPSYEATVQVIRMLQLLERSHGRSLPLNRLARELGVHRRTVSRWVATLEGALENDRGEPFLRRRRREGELWVDLPSAGPAIGGTVFQYAAVSLAAEALRGSSGSLLADGATDVVEILEDAAGWRLAPMLRRVDTAFHYLAFGPKDHQAKEDVLDPVIQALLRQQRLRLTYRVPGLETAELTVEPLTLVLYRDGLYLLAQRASGETTVRRTYALDRIERAKVLRAEHFELPPDYRPADVFEGGLGIFEGWGPREQVRIAFEASAATVARERQWPEPSSWTDEGGRCVLEMQTRVTPEVVAWVLSWGASAEVLAPGSLREEVAGAFEAAARMYR